MDPTFFIKIDGAGATPETIRLRDLYDLLRHYESAVSSTVESQADFHLIQIAGGSTTCTVAVEPLGFMAAVKCANAIAKRDLSGIPERARDNILEIQAKVKNKGWTVRFSGVVGMPYAEIGPDTEFVSDSIIVGRSSLVARLVRIGGIPNATAHFVRSDGTRFTAAIANPELAARLATLLYHTVEVDGEAHWSTADLNLIKFKILNVGTYDDSANMADTLRDLASIAGDYWDDIDPDEYIADLRAG